MALDHDKLNAFIGQFVGEIGAAVHAGMVVIGERLGLYKALAGGAAHLGRIGSPNSHGRTVRAGVARFTGGRRLCAI